MEMVTAWFVLWDDTSLPGQKIKPVQGWFAFRNAVVGGRGVSILTGAFADDVEAQAWCDAQNAKEADAPTIVGPLS